MTKHNGLPDFTDDIGTANEEQRELLSSGSEQRRETLVPEHGAGAGLECELGPLPCPSPPSVQLCCVHPYSSLHTALVFITAALTTSG